MANPMAWDKVPAARFAQMDQAARFIPELAANSRARYAAGRDFTWWREDLALVQKSRASNSITLNEAERRRERDATKTLTNPAMPLV